MIEWYFITMTFSRVVACSIACKLLYALLLIANFNKKQFGLCPRVYKSIQILVLILNSFYYY